MARTTPGEGREPVGSARDLLDLLREWRTVNGSPTGREIAAQAGTSPGYVSEIFSGRKVPSPDMAADIVQAISPDREKQGRARRLAERAAAEKVSTAGGIAGRAPRHPHGNPFAASPDGTTFVERDGYSAEFARRLQRGDRLVAFVGEAGTGKSRLVRRLVEARLTANRESAILLRGQQLYSDISAVLARTDVRLTDMRPEDLRSALVHHLSSFDAPTYVVLDDLTDREFQAVLLNPAVRSTIITTGRRTIVPPGAPAPVVVRGMSDEESFQLIGQMLPEAPPADVAVVNELLRGRPLAIVHACGGLLADGFLTVDAFRTQFVRDAGAVMRRAVDPSQADDTMTRIYELTLERLTALDQRDGGQRARLLELLAFLSPEAIPEALARGAFADAFGNGPREASSYDVEFQVAQRDLSTRYLIERGPDGLSIHSLTQQLLCSILTGHGKAEAICVPLQHAVAAHLRAETDEAVWSSMTPQTLSWLPHMLAVARGLLPSTHRYEDTDFGLTLAALIRGYGHVGETQVAMTVLNSVPELSDSSRWSAAPYLYEAYVEALKLRYGLGLIDEGPYLRLISEVQLCLPRNEEGKVGPRFMRMLDIVEAAIVAGSLDDAFYLVKFMDGNDPSRTNSIPAVHVRKLRLLGEIAHGQANWSATVGFLDAAFLERERRGLHDWTHLREEMRGIATYVDNSMLSGAYDAAFVHEYDADALWRHKPEDVSDPLTEALWRYVKARCGHLRLMLARYSRMTYEVPADPERLNRLIKEADEHVRECADMFTRAGWRRHAHLPHGDYVTSAYLIGDPELVNAHEERCFELCRREGTPVAFWRFALAIEKIRLMTRQPPRDSTALSWMRVHIERIAAECARRTESPYLYTEFLAVSSVYDALAGRRSEGKLREIESSYRSLGRGRRWSDLQDALRNTPHDAEKRMKAFAALLLP